MLHTAEERYFFPVNHMPFHTQSSTLSTHNGNVWWKSTHLELLAMFSVLTTFLWIWSRARGKTYGKNAKRCSLRLGWIYATGWRLLLLFWGIFHGILEMKSGQLGEKHFWLSLLIPWYGLLLQIQTQNLVMKRLRGDDIKVIFNLWWKSSVFCRKPSLGDSLTEWSGNGSWHLSLFVTHSQFLVT